MTTHAFNDQRYDRPEGWFGGDMRTVWCAPIDRLTRSK